MTDTLRAQLDAQYHAREINKKIKRGKVVYLESPLNGQMAEVTRMRARKGVLQGRSAKTDKWLSTTIERTYVSV